MSEFHGVLVHNYGRLPAVVTGVMFGTKDSMNFVGESEVPVTLGISAERLFIIDADVVRKLIDINRNEAKQSREHFMATVILGNGKRQHFEVSVEAVERAMS